MEKLAEMDFFSKLLNYTNCFSQGYFPKYDGWDFTEHLFPTLANNLGGKVYGLAGWHSDKSQWYGNYKKFPMRWKPELTIKDNYPEASIMHPVKNTDHPLRRFHREKRNG